MKLERFNNDYGFRLVLSSEESVAATLVHNYLSPEEEARNREALAQAQATIEEAAAADLAQRYPDTPASVVLELARSLPEFPNPEQVWARADGAAILYRAFLKERRAMKGERAATRSARGSK